MTSPHDEARRIVDELEDEVVDVDEPVRGETEDTQAAEDTLATEDTSPTTPGAEPSA